MKRYIKIFSLHALILSLISCTSDMELKDSGRVSGSTITIMGHPSPYSKFNVSTKAEKSEEYISSMTMLIFDSADDLVGKPITIHESEPVFLIDTKDQLIGSVEDDELTPMEREGDEKQRLLNESVIYIVANAAEVFESGNINIKNLEDLNRVRLDVTDLNMPKDGFPMIGHSEIIDLSKDREATAGDIKEIPLDKLYAKVQVKMRVQAEQSGSTTPSFVLNKWVVKNAPDYVSLGQYSLAESGETINKDFGSLTDFESLMISEGKKTIYHSNTTSDGEFMIFTFYIPEFKVLPDEYPEYPNDDIKNDEGLAQRYKPQQLGKDDKAPYIQIHGTYIDHSGTPFKVIYDLYLGQDSVSDFHVERNWNLMNNVTIKGITNNNFIPGQDGNNNISVDYRVTLEEKNFIVHIEREAMLDAHYEVRPMMVYLRQGGGRVEIEIDDACKEWIGLDKSPDPKDYFKTDLISTLDNSCFLESEKSKIWFYIDENLTDSPRQGTITLKYYDNQNTLKELVNMTLKQAGLLLVDERWNTDTNRSMKLTDDTDDGGGNDFYIESFEEYLHHFDPLDAPFSDRVYEGLPWGVGSHPRIAENEWYGTQYYQNLYKGQTVTPIIVSKYDDSDDLTLSEIPSSAAEYCHNKNKRNKDGTVNTDSGSWYLPGIREMEASFYEYYDVFKEFQENFYWSSAPGKYVMILTTEDTGRARATKAIYEDDRFNYVESGNQNAAGSKDRDDILRIRCAYRPK